MSRKIDVTSLGLLFGVLLTCNATAVPISGTFSGNATGLLEGFPAMEFSGPVQGHISFDPDIGPDDDFTRTEHELEIFSGAPKVRITFAVMAGDVSFDLGEFDSLARIVLFDDGVRQSLSLVQTDICCSDSRFELVGASHNLFRNFDPTTFDPRDIDLQQSNGRFSARFFGGFDVALSSISFGSRGGVGNAGVPEPATVGLLLLSFPLLLWSLRPARNTHG